MLHFWSHLEFPYIEHDISKVLDGNITRSLPVRMLEGVVRYLIEEVVSKAGKFAVIQTLRLVFTEILGYERRIPFERIFRH